MTPFGHKKYMVDCLDRLGEYVHLCAEMGAKKAFVYIAGTPYQEVEKLPGLPYVCFRVPTGGGKTVMGCRAISVLANELSPASRAIVLWLVPTDTIKTQTLNAMKDRTHPYRQLLDVETEGRVSPMDVTEALSMPQGTAQSDTVIIVSTLAAPRIGDTDQRKIYEQNGSLMSHFSDLPESVLGRLERYDDSSKPVPSLANLLRLYRPIIIMDEAHNARTQLSFETLARFDPSFILELTATPVQHPLQNPSNVLCSVSAAELKAEEMIKLPIELESHSDWEQTMLSAINRRRELEGIAQQECDAGGDYVRPIVLFQAQKRNEDLPVAAVWEELKRLGLPEHEMAVETGERSDLANQDLFSPSCPIRYVITVDKLREGWDCSFAYVLCSVREMSSRTAVEQILGRILRMPNATRRQHDELNRAYAYVTSQQFADTSRALDIIAQALEGNGFTKFEARQAVEQKAMELDGLFATDPRPPTPAERREIFAVPQLALELDGELEPFSADLLHTGWNLAKCSARLSEEEFSLAGRRETAVVDVNQQGRTTIAERTENYILGVQDSLAALIFDDFRTAAEAAVWLDRQIPHPDIPQNQAQAFLIVLVEQLVLERNVSLVTLSRNRLRLRQCAAAKIDAHRTAARKAAYQQILFDSPAAQVQVSAECVFSYNPDQYPANELYPTPLEFKRHYYRAVGAMNGEEKECARRLDSLPNVAYWVRNLERQEEFSFWLQLPKDRFYPDFVAKLTDDRIAAIEYKGGHLEGAPDAEEKRRIGELWEAQSGGKCVFLMVNRENYDAQLRSLSV